MTQKNTWRGFTLIELLVVVLIIGILAVIALPQYQKAVTRAKTAELFAVMDAVAKDAQTYLYTQGTLDSFKTMVDASKGMVDWDAKTFGKNFQVGTQSSSSSMDEVFYCIHPNNGDEAYIHYFIDITGKETKVCSGGDCGKYIHNASCFAEPSECYAVFARSRGCTFQ